MAYGTVKIDTITFTDGGVDKSVSVSGLTRNPTFSGDVTVTGTVSGTTVRATTVSGVTVTGTTVNAASGVFTTTLSGATVTGTTAQFVTATATTGSFASLTGTTTTGTTANFASGVFTTQISGAIIKVPAGTAGAPTVQVGTGATVAPGLYSAGTDQLAFSTSGTGQLFIDASGNVGIGGAPTAVKLYVNGQIVGTSGTYALRASNGSGTGQTSIGLTREGASTDQKTWELLQGNSGEILLRTINDAYSASQNAIVINRGSSYNVDNISLLTMGSNRLYINSGGNVGIGTTGPSVPLHVAGIARIGANNTDDAELQIGVGATGNRNAFIDLVGDTTYTDYGLRLIRPDAGPNTSSYLLNRGTGTLYLTAQDAGNVAFQTSNTTRAYFSGTTFKLTNATDIRNDVNTGNVTIFGGDGTGANIELYGGSHASLANLMVLDAGEFRFRSQDGTSDRLRIDSSGKVGIGTSSPGTELDVQGEIRSKAYSGEGGQLTLTDASNTNVFYMDVDSTGIQRIFTSANNKDIQIGQLIGTGCNIRFYTENTERLRIASSGSLLVGTSLDSGGALLQVEGNRIRVATAKTPSSASDTGTTGEICWDASYIYVCTATNTWKRAALSTW